jgi:NTP pyrophosphatase (non-canonical NTP hydrolase)
MRSNLEQAKEFRTKYNIKNSDSRRARAYQLSLIIEEYKEFLLADEMLCRNTEKYKEECLKELADLVYVCYQYAVNMGWDLDKALKLVHKSNLSKLDEEGKPILRDDGKILKGPNYKKPNLHSLING